MAKRRSVSEQARRLTNGQINRRRFIMSAVASGVTLPTATALATKAEARVPQRGGTLRIASASSANAYLARATGNTLTRLTSDGRVVGELATGLSVSDDFSRWIFKLRDDVTFQDGAPMTAPRVAGWFQSSKLIDGAIQAQGNETLEVRLNTPTPEFHRLLAQTRYTVRDGNSGNTTGGYIITASEGAETSLTRNPDYWKPDAAHFDNVEILTISDPVARHRAIMTGAVTYADEINPQAVATLKGLPTLDILETEGTHHFAFPMRRDIAPFDNPALRAQISDLVNGEAILSSVALGHGQAASMAPEQVPAQPPTEPVPLFVSEEAVPGSLRAAELLRTQAERYGVRITIENTSAANWPKVSATAGWYATRGQGAPSPDAIPGLSLNALAAYSSQLAHPAHVSDAQENDAYRITDRWWFDTRT